MSPAPVSTSTTADTMSMPTTQPAAKAGPSLRARGVPSIKICTGYELDGKYIETVPANENVLAKCVPIYEELEGWQAPTTEVRNFDDLPPQAKVFIRRVEALLGCPVDLISVGPSREQAIIVNPIF